MNISKVSLIITLGIVVLSFFNKFFLLPTGFAEIAGILIFGFVVFISPLILIILLVRFLVYKERNFYLYASFLLNLAIFVLIVYGIYDLFHNSKYWEGIRL